MLLAHAEDDPARDVALSHALLERAAREKVACARVWRPRREAVSLGRLDVRSPGLAEAVAVARAAGIEPVRRLCGGRAAVVDEGCLSVGWAEPDPVLEESTLRYARMSVVVADALADLGVAAGRQELPGEWCPGAWSLRGRGGKLVGIAQRVVRGGAWCEAMIVVSASERRRELSQRLHGCLDIPWSDAAQGALIDEQAGIDHAMVAEALTRTLERTWPELSEAEADDDLLARVAELSNEHTMT